MTPLELQSVEHLIERRRSIHWQIGRRLLRYIRHLEEWHRDPPVADVVPIFPPPPPRTAGEHAGRGAGSHKSTEERDDA